MTIVTVLVPAVVGLKLIVKLVLLPGAIGDSGGISTENSEAFSPVIFTYGGSPYKIKLADPRFSIINVAELVDPCATLPKSQFEPEEIFSVPCLMFISEETNPFAISFKGLGHPTNITKIIKRIPTKKKTENKLVNLLLILLLIL